MATRQVYQLDKMSTTGLTMVIEKIDVIQNETLNKTFREKQKKFSAQGRDSRELFLFHGTPAENVDPIVKENFDLKKGKRFLYGKGMYFSEHPMVCNTYGPGLILCKVLLGKMQEKSGGKLNPGKFDSFKAGSSIYVIKSAEQILPFAVLHLRREVQPPPPVPFGTFGMPAPTVNPPKINPPGPLAAKIPPRNLFSTTGRSRILKRKPTRTLPKKVNRRLTRDKAQLPTKRYNTRSESRQVKNKKYLTRQQKRTLATLPGAGVGST